MYRFDGTLPEDDKVFADLLKAICAGETTNAPWEAMLLAENIHRTYKAIIDLKNRTMAALGSYEAEFTAASYSSRQLPREQGKRVFAEAKQDILRRKEQMLRFHRSVDNHIQELKAARHEVRKVAHQQESAYANRGLRDRIRELEAALRLALTYVDPAYRDHPDIGQAHVVLEASGAWWHYADAAAELIEAGGKN